MRKLSLYHLFFGSLVILITLLVSLILLNIDLQRKELSNREIDEKVHLAEIVNEALFSPLLTYRTGGSPQLESILLQEIAKFRDVTFIKLVDVNGRVMGSSIEGERGQIIGDPDIVRVLTSKQNVIKDGDYQEEKIKLLIYPGYGDQTIWIGFTLETINSLVRTTMIRSLTAGLGAVFFVAVFLLLLLRIIIVPIKKMTLACEEIMKGNLDVKIDVKSKMEIGTLAAIFNEMVEDVRTSRAALEEARDVLEIKVKARTRELQDLNASLEEEVRRRTQEVYEKMEQLERFQKIAVDRELKMIELKKELAEALSKKTKKNHGSPKKES